ncbi:MULTISPECIES: succinylglutamate desuccinylase/aspartoacylase family protein [unclassified Caballeronia]|uniref:succinylglutamate desuccinylase/aspartoacylase family protein n=1 Tax=unclassified Caballeronia TaxID=2646786 RepID=UPI002864FA71|nr:MULTISPECIES: succinylglutamate desuccinylase/aspartoacylase family protein [unclassified Caballeronia]MDR5739401.1 succinylglutamate desuccinylase/aspartoacylase family protein [Caballeronia sp. LZ016]MDR5807889.1 succinylglutamate desuccinylase/aspartoacylase family protein [Caballeronia sp. LZ019]
MQVHSHPLAGASPGTERAITSYRFGPQGYEAPKVYIQASLHADELPGIVVAWLLRRRFADLEAAGRLHARIVLVPVANPAGLNQHWFGAQMGRFDMRSGHDFNRRFPDPGPALAMQLDGRLTGDLDHNARLIRAALRAHLAAQTGATELESQRIALMRLACDADVVIDLHCDWEAVPHLYTTPEAWPSIEPLARYLGSEAQLLADVSGGEPFDEACASAWRYLRGAFGGRFPIPAGVTPVTLELRGVRDVSHDTAARDAQAIVDYLTHAGFIDGDAPEPPALRRPATPLAGCDYVHSPSSGVILHACDVGDTVRAGDVVAEILDPLDDRLVPLVAQTDGVLYARHWTRFATAGMLVARIAGEGAAREGDLLVP